MSGSRRRAGKAPARGVSTKAPTATALLVSAATLCACAGPDDAGAPSVELRDSAGITIVENGSLDRGRELLADSAPILEIGVVDGAEAYQLFEVMDAKRLSDGGFAVVNAGSRELKVFDADGTHRVTVGGPGQGPSEFGYPIAVRLRGVDSVLVQDRVDRVWFTSRGDFLGRASTSRQDLVALNERFEGFAEGGYWMPDGRLFTQVYARDAAPPTAGPLYRPRMTFVLVSGDLTAADTLADFGGIEQQYLDTGDGRPSSNVTAFARNTSWSVGAADGTIVAGDNAVPQVELFRPDGGRTLARWTAEPVRVTGADVDAWKERYRRLYEFEDYLPRLERAWLVMDVPETRPYYSRVASGSDGRIWLGPAWEDVEGWLVFDADGRYQGSAALPARFQPMDSGPGWVLGVVRDENDVELLRLYRLADP